MARMIPATFDRTRTSDGEQDLFERLAGDPATGDWIVLHSLDVSEHPTQVSGEIDFLVIIPGEGVLCLEVKACRSLKRDAGTWYYGTNPKPDHRGPFKQASAAMHSIRSRLTKIKLELGHVVFWSAAVFPYLQFTEQSAEWFPWQVIDRGKYCGKAISAALLDVIRNAKMHLEGKPSVRSWFYGKDSGVPYPQQCDLLLELLRPDFEIFESRKSRQTRFAREIKRLTEAQYEALDAMLGNDRTVFHGPAGTGKTFLAIEQCRRNHEAGRRTLLLCFNHHLSSWLAREVSCMAPSVTVSTLHSLMLRVAGAKAQPVWDSPDYWNRLLPSIALDELLLRERQDLLFDELVIDEAQDLIRPEFIDFLDLMVRGGLAGGKWRFFGDFEKQNLYSTYNFLHEWKKQNKFRFSEYSLRINCRNTPRIAIAAQSLGDMRPRYGQILRADDHVTPQLRPYASVQEQPGILASILESFKSEQYSPGEIVVLSMVNQQQCAAVAVKSEPWKSMLRPYDISRSDSLMYTTIHAFKGLEAPVVIITDIERLDGAEATDLLYVGVTRALERLVLIFNANLKSIIQERILSG